MPKRANHRLTVFITLFSAGVFILGAGLIPLLIKTKQAALNSVDLILPPTVTNLPAPRLALTDLQGNSVSIEAYRGEVILVNNWATWCPPCQIEMPELQAYYTAHTAEGFVVLAIESGEPADQVASFVKDHGLTFPVWLDAHSLSLEAFNNWDLPSSYVIDKGGTVRLAWTGGVNQPTLEKYITPLLEENK